jgi:hypothetical protein
MGVASQDKIQHGQSAQGGGWKAVMSGQMDRC